MLFVATSASAQFQQSNSSSTLSSDDVNGYNSLYFQYNPQKLKDESGYNGLVLGWKNGIALSSSQPFFLEAGLAFQYTFYSKDDVKTNIGTLSIPLNLTYRIAIPDSKFAIAPYLGFALKGHLWGKQKFDSNYYGDDDINLFSDDDMSGDPANRIQVAFQVGANFCLDKAYLGVGYGTDLSDFTKKCKFSSLNLTLGFNL